MITFKEVKIILIALLIAILVALVTRFIVLPSKVAKPVKSDEIEILVATSKLQLGDVLAPATTKWQLWPKTAVGPEFVTNKNEAQKIMGATLRVETEAGEPIMRTKLILGNDKGILTSLITPGMRAFTVPISGGHGSSVTSLISAGDYVDIIVATRSADGKGYVGKMVAENVRVLEVDGSFERTQKGSGKLPRYITVEVDSKKDEILAAELKEGEATISLHSATKDKKEQEREKLGVAGQVDSNEEESVTISVIRGVNKSDVTFKR